MVTMKHDIETCRTIDQWSMNVNFKIYKHLSTIDSNIV